MRSVVIGEMRSSTGLPGGSMGRWDMADIGSDWSGERAAWQAEYAVGRYVSEPPLEFVNDILAITDDAGLIGAKGLYIGCGNGRNYVPLVHGGLDLIGLDISSTAIAQLVDRYPERKSHLVVGDLGDLPDDWTFSIVIGIQVFQHGTTAKVHEHLREAQNRVSAGGLFFLRVNAVGTEVWPEHDVVEQTGDGAFTVRYLEGAKAGLDVHFFSEAEIDDLFTGWATVFAPRIQVTHREAPAPGSWSQWEGAWRRGGS